MFIFIFLIPTINPARFSFILFFTGAQSVNMGLVSWISINADRLSQPDPFPVILQSKEYYEKGGKQDMSSSTTEPKPSAKVPPLCEHQLESPRIDSKESIPPAYVAWRTTLLLLGSQPPQIIIKFQQGTIWSKSTKTNHQSRRQPFCFSIQFS